MKRLLLIILLLTVGCGTKQVDVVPQPTYPMPSFYMGLGMVQQINTLDIIRISLEQEAGLDLGYFWMMSANRRVEIGMCLYGKIEPLPDSLLIYPSVKQNFKMIVVEDVELANTMSSDSLHVSYSCVPKARYLGRAHTHIVRQEGREYPLTIPSIPDAAYFWLMPHEIITIVVWGARPTKKGTEVLLTWQLKHGLSESWRWTPR